MQQAAATPHRFHAWGPHNPDAPLAAERPSAAVVRENPVVVVGRRGCCMVHVIRCLLTAHGVNPIVYEAGHDDADEIALIKDLVRRGARRDGERRMKAEMALPVLFIGGELVGGVERVMAVQISGELANKLKEAGAIWL